MKVFGIERTHPRDGIPEAPAQTADGSIKLAHPRHGYEKHHAKHIELANALE